MSTIAVRERGYIAHEGAVMIRGYHRRHLSHALPETAVFFGRGLLLRTLADSVLPQVLLRATAASSTPPTTAETHSASPLDKDRSSRVGIKGC
jgi:hypothetical protein